MLSRFFKGHCYQQINKVRDFVFDRFIHWFNCHSLRVSTLRVLHCFLNLYDTGSFYEIIESYEPTCSIFLQYLILKLKLNLELNGCLKKVKIRKKKRSGAETTNIKFHLLPHEFKLFNTLNIVILISLSSFISNDTN